MILDETKTLEALQTTAGVKCVELIYETGKRSMFRWDEIHTLEYDPMDEVPRLCLITCDDGLIEFLKPSQLLVTNFFNAFRHHIRETHNG